MPKIKVLPHPEVCPQGVEIEVPIGTSVIRALLANGIHIEHACEMQCACTTCHVKFSSRKRRGSVRQGMGIRF